MQTPNSLLGNSKEKLDTSSADFNAKSGAIDFVSDTSLSLK